MVEGHRPPSGWETSAAPAGAPARYAVLRSAGTSLGKVYFKRVHEDLKKSLHTGKIQTPNLACQQVKEKERKTGEQSFLREGRVVGPRWEKLRPKGPKAP